MYVVGFRVVYHKGRIYISRNHTCSHLVYTSIYEIELRSSKDLVMFRTITGLMSMIARGWCEVQVGRTNIYVEQDFSVT